MKTILLSTDRRVTRAATFRVVSHPRVAHKATLSLAYGPRVTQQPMVITPSTKARTLTMTDVLPAANKPKPAVRPVHVVAPQPFVSPAHPKQQQSKVLRRQAVKRPMLTIGPVIRRGKLQTALRSCFGLSA